MTDNNGTFCEGELWLFLAGEKCWRFDADFPTHSPSYLSGVFFVFKTPQWFYQCAENDVD